MSKPTPNYRESTTKVCQECWVYPAVEVQLVWTYKSGKTRAGKWEAWDLCEACLRKQLDDCNNPEVSQQLADEGMWRAYNAAKGIWTETAKEIVFEIARENVFLSPDMVWARFNTQYPGLCKMKNPSALGVVMTSLSWDAEKHQGGIIVHTQKWERSRRKKAHRSPKTVWHSLICGSGMLSPEEFSEAYSDFCEGLDYTIGEGIDQ